ncbi:hypothetical protein TRVL_10325 [Trypanosoma vivax]|uniref:Uncharacterized protein n=1 Tax=Trypanosoma vivax (strain Y486) TaxID=1055687 RepID=G0UA71_TRYVY|nr:hypothetical protein TRVL_10325 [Trypanosoma vivax]CCC52703.1 conserved hypothetical protein [Trypanosoma vivax Y486]
MPVTDASMCGWCALLLKDNGEVCVAGGAREREPRCISRGEAREVLLVLSSFAEAMAKNLHTFVGNTTVMNVRKATQILMRWRARLRLSTRRWKNSVFRPLVPTLPLPRTPLTGFSWKQA